MRVDLRNRWIIHLKVVIMRRTGPGKTCMKRMHDITSVPVPRYCYIWSSLRIHTWLATDECHYYFKTIVMRLYMAGNCAGKMYITD